MQTGHNVTIRVRINLKNLFMLKKLHKRTLKKKGNMCLGFTRVLSLKEDSGIELF